MDNCTIQFTRQTISGRCRAMVLMTLSGLVFMGNAFLTLMFAEKSDAAIGSDAYLYERFGIRPESAAIWAHRDYSVMHYRDPATPPSETALPETVVPWNSWPYTREKPHAEFAGLNSVSALFYAYPSRRVAIWSEEIVDPKQNGALSDRTSPKLKFCSAARWGWSPGHFLAPAIVCHESDESETAVSKGALQGLNIMEEGGERVMADFVWPLLVEEDEIGHLVLRCVIRADEPLCLYARAFLVGNSALRFKQIQLVSWGGYPADFPGSETWIDGITAGTPIPQKGTELALADYWFYAVYKKKLPVFGDRGSLAIFLPETLNKLIYQGGWAGTVTLVPTQEHARSMAFALQDLGGRGAGEIEDLIAESRNKAPARRQRLSTMNWRPAWEKQLARIDAEIELIRKSLGEDSDIVKNLSAQRDQCGALIAESNAVTTDSSAGIGNAAALQALNQAIDNAWTEAVQELLVDGSAVK